MEDTEPAFTLELRTFAVQSTLPQRIVDSVYGSEVKDRAARLLVRSMYAEMVVSKSSYITFPKDWWQGVKQRWFPGWVKEMSPVRLACVEWWLGYPEAPRSFGESAFNWQVADKIPSNISER